MSLSLSVSVNIGQTNGALWRLEMFIIRYLCPVIISLVCCSNIRGIFGYEILQTILILCTTNHFKT